MSYQIKRQDTQIGKAARDDRVVKGKEAVKLGPSEKNQSRSPI